MMDEGPDMTGTRSDPTLADWIRASRIQETGSRGLPPHHPYCLGCGPANPHGHQLRASRCGQSVVAHHVFDERHVGAPGIAHGGAVATVVDDLFGFLLYPLGELAVTRHLDVDYLAPVRLNTPYTLCADLRFRDGRKLHLGARIEDTAGRSVVTATAVFVVVDPAHFTGAHATAQAPR